MNRYIWLAAVVTAGGGLAVVAFLQAAAAVADPSDTGSDAGFTIGNLAFNDPVGTVLGTQTAGYQSFDPLFSNAPLLALGGDNAIILSLGSQGFTVEDSSGATLGTVATQVNVQDLLSIDSAQFTVTSTDPATGLTATQLAELPADGTVYSITNIGGGFANVYEAVPNAGGTAASKITDTLLTPFGNFAMPTSYDAIAPANPIAPLDALGVTSGATGLSDNAFTIGSTTFDPGSDGLNALSLNAGAIAPLLNLNLGSLSASSTFANPGPMENFAVYSGATDAGSAYTSMNNLDLLGIVNGTQFTVQAINPTGTAVDNALTNSGLDFSNAGFNANDLANALVTVPLGKNFGIPAYAPLDFNGDITGQDVTAQLAHNGFSLGTSGISASDIAGVLNTVSTAGLPVDGTVYSVTDLGGGFENVYQAIPGTGGGAATLSDTFVTPFGNFNVPTSYDATAPMNPGAPFEALGSALSSAGLSDNAFTLDGTTFDPGSTGFSPVYAIIGIAPLLEISGANLLGHPLVTQSGVEMYDSSGADLGTVTFGENVSNIFGIETSQLTVSAVDAATGLTAAQTAELPVDGTVYSVANLGSGWENVYEAIPGSGTTTGATITDTLITPFGNMDLSSLFGSWDATAPLDVGDAVDGVNAGSSAAADAMAGFDLFDPSTWF
ncbi:hypothetical protein [[Mycobacterium] crassicus]|uniref:Uncharacterized protein n=1 Tax=[Mycobacterium] crassicus TaxID=2872309 RepID=A0ABU5XP34_9MYCO|nr:hypothetical protein [Mycolicibacter sp. MYC098]MEB3024025.1 hypothetical protein [Mycolicibacter sp. MYC098]